MSKLNLLSTATQDFLNVVVNPMDSNKPAQVPDMNQFSSLCMTDSANTQNPTNPTAATDAVGIIVWLRCNYSYWDFTYNQNPNRIYSLNWAVLGAGNLITLTALAKHSSTVPINMPTILGGTSYSDTASLITSGRIFGMGVQLLSTIEVVTDTTVNYLTQIVGGQLSTNEINSIYQNASDAYLAVRNSACAKLFSNSRGCTVRYDPFQNENQLNVQDGQLMYDYAVNYGWVKNPVIVAKFSQVVPAGQPMPVILNARFWLEAGLRQPTPIYSQQSPVDLQYPLIRSIMTGCVEAYPVVSEGHSFAPFVLTNPKFLSIVARSLQGASNIVNTANNFINNNNKKRKNNNGTRKNNGNITRRRNGNMNLNNRKYNSNFNLRSNPNRLNSIAGRSQPRGARGPVRNYTNMRNS